MSGSSKSMNHVTFANARIAGSPRYTPAHVPANSQDGKPISAKCEFAVYQNGRNNSESVFKITIWGKRADTIARGGATGKELTMFCEVNSYRGKVWLPNPNGGRRQAVTLNDGSFLFQDKIGFTIRDFIFGDDSEKCITNEINAYDQSGGAQGRPKFWNVPGHQDNQIWKQIREMRNNQQYQPGAPTFGYATVFVPEGARIVTDQGQSGTGQVQAVGNVQAVQQNFGGYNQPTGQVQTGYTPPVQQNPGVQVNNGQVMVNDQNMGTAMPNTGMGTAMPNMPNQLTQAPVQQNVWQPNNQAVGTFAPPVQQVAQQPVQQGQTVQMGY